MSPCEKTLIIIVLVLCSLMWSSVDAYAYIDPNTGSIIFQTVIASLVAGGFIARKFWRNIVDFFAKFRPKSNDDGNK